MRLECQNLQTISNTSVELNQSGILIEGCQFCNSNISLTNNRQSGVYAKIANSVFGNSTADALIRIEHYPSYSIENCTLNYSQGSGIDIYYCGWRNGKVNITGNSIQKSGSSQDLSWGIRIYGSFAAIENNLITNNRYGISCLNQSQVRISGNPDAQQPGQTQRIINNFQNQIRVSDNSFPYYLHHNIIQNFPPGETSLVYFDNKAVITPYPIENPSLFDARCNCFDNADPSGQLHPSGWYTWSVWCPPSLCSLEDDGREGFDVASASMDSALFNLAESQFKDLISNYPGTIYARESAKKLVALEKITDHNFISLRNYFDTATALNSDSLSKQLIYRLLNQCTLETGDYPQAITWFENDIMNPLSEDDSVFSLIDIGDAYLRMASDTLLKAHGTNISVNLPDLRPSGRLHHENRREEWIQLLFKDSPGVNHELPAEETEEKVRVIRNHPNPFTTITNLEYYQYNDGIVTLTIYDTFGRIVWHKESPVQSKGKYKCQVDLSSFSAGIYIMKSLINNKPSEKISLIKI